VPGPPRLSYLICTTPRSGSTLLCELLAATGIAGRPDEYFQQLRSTGQPMSPRDYLDGAGADLLPARPVAAAPLEEHSLYDPRRFASFEHYLSWVKERATTDNGVLGFKIMWPYVGGLVAGLSGDGRADPHSVLSASFPQLRYVWLRRSDKVRQAVSLWRAVQTWHWRQDAGTQAGGARPAATLRYSYEAIDHLRRLLVSSDRAWEIYFEATGAAPLTLTYEKFVDEMDETVIALLRRVGVKHPRDARYLRPRTARQADATSEEWVTEFKREFAARGVPAFR
jgi:trehalose 2-sulfotransferase